MCLKLSLQDLRLENMTDDDIKVKGKIESLEIERMLDED